MSQFVKCKRPPVWMHKKEDEGMVENLRLSSRELQGGDERPRRRSFRQESKLVLIHTIDQDFHAAVCGHALENRGHRVVRWLGEDYPVSAGSSLHISEGERVDVLHTRHGSVSSCEVDVVWYRRRRAALAPDYLDADDMGFAENELKVAECAHADGFERAFWINRRAAASISDIKPNQLRAAQDSGLEVPPTLISNDPYEIRDFIRRHGSTIYKPLTGHTWGDGGCVRRTYTAAVTLQDLPEDRYLKATPGIFQRKIDKAFEVRAQFFGSVCLAVRIESNSLRGGDVDWRLDQRSITRCAPIDVPLSIQDACRKLMGKLGLVSGGVDFIVSPDGSWCFLEINEAGQFLFIESWCAELKVLEAFCQFVESGEVDLGNLQRSQHIGLEQAILSARVSGLLRAQ